MERYEIQGEPIDKYLIGLKLEEIRGSDFEGFIPSRSTPGNLTIGYALSTNDDAGWKVVDGNPLYRAIKLRRCPDHDGLLHELVHESQFVGRKVDLTKFDAEFEANEISARFKLQTGQTLNFAERSALKGRDSAEFRYYFTMAYGIETADELPFLLARFLP